MGWSFPTTKTVEIQNAYGPKFREMPVSKKESVRFAKTRLTKITEIPGKMKVPNLKILAYVEGSDDLGVYEELKPVRLSQIIQEWINHEELVYAQLV